MHPERTCPACAAALSPTDNSCTRCGAAVVDDARAALDALRGHIVAIDMEMSRLMTQRQSLVDEYERRRFALLDRPQPTASPAAAPERREWSGARVRALLLWLGAALLGLSALTFTAVAWSRLGDGGRAVLLVGATVVVTGLAIALRRRLPMTADAVAGLAIVLTLVDVYAARRAGLAPGMSWQVWWAIGTAAAAGYAAALGTIVGRRAAWFAVAALLPIPLELLTVRFAGTEWVAAMVLAVLAAAIVYAQMRWARHVHPEGRVVLGLHAAGSWVAAAALAGAAAAQPDTVAAAVGPAVAVGLLAAAPEFALHRLAHPALCAALAVLAHGVPAGFALTVVGPLLGTEGTLAAAVVAGGATIFASLFLPAARRAGALVAGALFALPGTLWALAVTAPVVLGPLNWLGDPWSGNLDVAARDAVEGPGTWAPAAGSWAAVGALGAIAAVGLALGTRRRALLGITTAAAGLASALAPVTAGASVLVVLVVTTAAFVLVLIASALTDRAQAHRGWALLPGAATAAAPTIGWSALSPGASVVTLALTTAAGGAAAVIARSVAARSAYAGLGALLGVAFAGVAAAAAGAGAAPAGFAAVVAAGAVMLLGAHLLRDEPGTGAALEGTGALAAFTGAVVAADSTPWLAGALTALMPVASIAALRKDRRVLYGCAAGALALGAVWAWLAAARVDIVEAYTAPAAALALAAGIAGWRFGRGRSWLTLGPALVLTIGPTLALGIVDDDVVRLIVVAALSLAAVVAGAVRRLQAPLCLGAAALVALGIDQWGDDIVRMPRWITFGVIGLLLMWIGATFERRRHDWRRASDLFGDFG